MLLSAKNISFKYRKDPWIIRNFDLEINSGEVLGLSGPSGCGKTTLAKILAGHCLPVTGSVKIDGKDVSQKGFNPVQLIFQHPEKALNPRWRMDKALKEGFSPDDDLLAALGIEKEWLYRWPNELSGGELQRFCIARALSPKTKFLIADEMTTMLDAITQSQIWNAVLDIAKKNNIGVLVVSHDNHLLNHICDKVLLPDTFTSADTN